MILLFSDLKTLRFHQQRPASPASPASSASPARACRPTSPSLKIESRSQACQKAQAAQNPRNSRPDTPANPWRLSRAGAAQNSVFAGSPPASSASRGQRRGAAAPQSFALEPCSKGPRSVMRHSRLASWPRPPARLTPKSRNGVFMHPCS